MALEEKKINSRKIVIDIPNKKLIKTREPREISNSKKRRSSWTKESFKETKTNEYTPIAITKIRRKIREKDISVMF